MGLDAVELVMAWEEAFGIEIPDRDAAGMRTVREAIDWIGMRVNARPLGPCRTRRAFHRLRCALVEELGVPRAAVRPKTPLGDLLPSSGMPRERWERLGERLGRGWSLARVDWAGDLLAGVAGIHRPRRYRARRAGQTVGEAVRDIAVHDADLHPRRGEPWSREAVALLVRRITIEELGVSGFSDDASFVADLGV